MKAGRKHVVAVVAAIVIATSFAATSVAHAQSAPTASVPALAFEVATIKQHVDLQKSKAATKTRLLIPTLLYLSLRNHQH